MIRPLLLLSLIALAGCDDQIAKNLTGQSGVDRALPTTTAFFTAPAVAHVPEPGIPFMAIPVIEPEPIVEPVVEVCVPVFRVVECP